MSVTRSLDPWTSSSSLCLALRTRLAAFHDCFGNCHINYHVSLAVGKGQPGLPRLGYWEVAEVALQGTCPGASPTLHHALAAFLPTVP